MAKLILIVLVAFIVYALIRGYARRLPKDGARPVGEDKAAGGGEAMVRCSHCGVHLPRSEGILARDQFYCSEEHRRIGQR